MFRADPGTSTEVEVLLDLRSGPIFMQNSGSPDQMVYVCRGGRLWMVYVPQYLYCIVFRARIQVVSKIQS